MQRGSYLYIGQKIIFTHIFNMLVMEETLSFTETIITLLWGISTEIFNGEKAIFKENIVSTNFYFFICRHTKCKYFVVQICTSRLPGCSIFSK